MPVEPTSLSPDRDVAACVLIESMHSVAHVAATLDALAAQSRQADLVCVAYAADVEDDVLDLLNAACDDGRIDELVSLEEGSTRSDALDLVIDALADVRRTVREREDAAVRHEKAERERESAEASGRDFSLVNPAYGPRGRRARAVDFAEQEKENVRTASHEARVPLRLRDSAEPAAAPLRRRARRTGESWVWVLTGNAIPDSGALAALLGTLDATPGLGMVGPKHVAIEDLQRERSRIVDLGLSVTPSHRIISGVEPGEIDQGQVDWRRDVLAVSIPGVLVREESYARLGGYDPHLQPPFSDIDFSERMWRQGERIQVVPDATVRTSIEANRIHDAETRASQVFSLLKFRSCLAALLTLLMLPFVTLGRVVWAIARHDASLVVRELHALALVISRSGRTLAQARRDHAKARVSRRRLAPLMVPWSAAARDRLEAGWVDLVMEDERTRRMRRTTWGISGTSHGLDDADYGRHTMWTVIVAVTASVAGLAALRHLFGPGDITGGAWVPPARSVADMRDAIVAAWIPTGLGEAGASDALTRILGNVPVSGPSLAFAILVAAVPLAAVGAWVAAGTLSRSIPVRLVATLMWLVSPPCVDAALNGRLGPLILMVALPYALVALARAVGLPHKVSQASVAAAAAAGLLIALISAVQPALGLAIGVGLAAIAWAVPGRRARLWWCVIPMIAVHLPNLSGYVARPESMLAVAGTTGLFDPPSTFNLALLSPTHGNPLANALSRESSTLLQVLASAPLVLAALGALAATLLLGAAGTVARYAALSAAGATLLAFVSARTVVGFDGTTPATAYPGPALALAAAALIAGAVCLGDALARRADGGSTGRKLAAGLCGALALAISAALGGTWVYAAPHASELERTSSPTIPAVAADSGTSPARGHTLVMEQASTGEVTARILNGEGLTLDNVSAAVRARLARAAESGDPYDDATQLLAETVAANVGATSSQSASRSLATFGITYVVVPGNVEQQAELVNALSTSPRFEQVTVSETGGLWRVLEPAARATLVTPGSPDEPLDSERTEVHDTIDAAPSERVIRLAERADPRWVARVGTTTLEPTTLDGWAQGFTVPAGVAGDLEIRLNSRATTVLVLVGYVVCGVTAIAALPRRRRRSEA